MPVYRKINLARTDEEIQNCYPVTAELRPHIASDVNKSNQFRTSKEFRRTDFT
ncbi:MAG TPA: hypothetical protein VF648_21490 [Pyrinomonadaceae bacterium]|jgi:hypothetical protein